MTIDSGVSNTAGYTFTGGDPTLTNIIGMSSITPYIGMGGGGKRRPLTKKIKRMSMGRIRSGKKLGKIQRIKKYVKKKKKSRINKKKNKRKTLRRGILKSIESGKPISKEDSKQLSPAMREFIKGMESDKSASVIKFSDFKSKPTKKKGRKKRTMTRASKNKRQLSKRGRSRMSGGAPRPGAGEYGNMSHKNMMQIIAHKRNPNTKEEQDASRPSPSTVPPPEEQDASRPSPSTVPPQEEEQDASRPSASTDLPQEEEQDASRPSASTDLPQEVEQDASGRSTSTDHPVGVDPVTAAAQSAAPNSVLSLYAEREFNRDMAREVRNLANIRTPHGPGGGTT